MRGLLDQWQIWAVGSALFAGLTAILAKLGVGNLPADFATLIRTLVILALALAIVLVSGQWVPPSQVPGQAWLALVLSGLATGVSWLCYFRAMKLGDAARVAPIDKLSVVFVAVFASVFLKEQLSGTNWLGVALIATGAVLVAVR